jgi:hypothetical protein
MARIEESEVGGYPRHAHLIRFRRQQLTAYGMETLQLEVGHRTHPQVLTESLDHSATTGIDLTSEIVEGDGLQGMVCHPALRPFHHVDPGRCARRRNDLA